MKTRKRTYINIRRNRWILAVPGIIMAGMLLIMSCPPVYSGKGILEGGVTIGPLSPVERPGFETPVPAGIFDSRKINIYDEKGKKLVAEVDIKQIDKKAEGTFSVQLSPGRYLVDVNHLGIDSSGDVPETVEIFSGRTTVLNIDIDTGIR
ncbi:MAG: hypothetical protein U1D67_09865 [Dehalococcoidia bacterium]|nr:hypothetical protein [Dehalococcoidia bacterium]